LRGGLLLVVVSAVSAVLVAAGCGTNGSPVADGRHFGYLKSVDASSTPSTVELDVAAFLSGEEANAAAAEDGVIAEGEFVPNDYYIRNEDKSVVTLDVAPDVRVTHIQCPDSCTDGISGDLDTFAASFGDTGEKTLLDEYRGAQSQYWITVRDGGVVAIDEQYLP
jgi:hypothetical protein